MVGALESAVHDRKMSRGRTGKPASSEALNPAADGKPDHPSPADQSPKPAAKRRRRSTAEFEQRIGDRFKHPHIIEQTLTIISALTSARHHTGSSHGLSIPV